MVCGTTVKADLTQVPSQSDFEEMLKDLIDARFLSNDLPTVDRLDEWIVLPLYDAFNAKPTEVNGKPRILIAHAPALYQMLGRWEDRMAEERTLAAHLPRPPARSPARVVQPFSPAREVTPSRTTDLVGTDDVTALADVFKYPNDMSMRSADGDSTLQGISNKSVLHDTKKEKPMEDASSKNNEQNPAAVSVKNNHHKIPGEQPEDHLSGKKEKSKGRTKTPKVDTTQPTGKKISKRKDKVFGSMKEVDMKNMELKPSMTIKEHPTVHENFSHMTSEKLHPATIEKKHHTKIEKLNPVKTEEAHSNTSTAHALTVKKEEKPLATKAENKVMLPAVMAEPERPTVVAKAPITVPIPAIPERPPAFTHAKTQKRKLAEASATPTELSIKAPKKPKKSVKFTIDEMLNKKVKKEKKKSSKSSVKKDAASSCDSQASSKTISKLEKQTTKTSLGMPVLEPEAAHIETCEVVEEDGEFYFDAPVLGPVEY